MKNLIGFFLLIFFTTITTSAFAQAKAPPSELPLSGWDIAKAPMFENPNNEKGKITFVVEIDSVGNVLTATVIKNELSDELAQKCEAKIREMSFVKNANSTTASGISKGTITFVFKEK